MNKKTLIVKLGALGDVVRTTVLLRELDGDIYWLSQRTAADLLGSARIARTYFLDDRAGLSSLQKVGFDLVINLEEDPAALELLGKLRTAKLIGVFLNQKGDIDYTEEASYWYDMSLVSRYGKKKADLLKMKNRMSVPEILLGMLGSRFNGQEYDIGVDPSVAKGTIGLINVSSGLWPNKEWHGYAKLSRLLEGSGYRASLLEMRDTLREHIDDINGCELIVCADTLGMHIALALKKKVVALFNCTSPHEIYDYGRMRKIVSPLYERAFYRKERIPEVIASIGVEEVYRTVMDILNHPSLPTPGSARDITA